MNIDLIKELSNIDAISGHEKPVRDYMLDKMPKGEVISDNLGSFLVKYKRGEGKKNVAVIAHMDEVGFLVKQIDENGFVKIINVGGIVCESILSTQLKLKTDAGEFIGAVIAHPPHNPSDKKVDIDSILVDFGFESASDAKNLGVNIGDPIHFVNNTTLLPNDKIITKALDNRFGCAAVIELANALDEFEVGNLYLGASVQEEVGLRGAQTILANVDAQIDYILVIDVSPVNDFEDKTACKVGHGPLIRVKDPRMVLTVSETKRLTKLATSNDIAHQHYFSKGGTDAAMLEVSGAGQKVAAICIAGRNVHTANTICSLNDYSNAIKLAKLYISEVMKG